jgi:CHAT domain-containing protein/tetratricopeptide (TPR) repeat protein
LGSAYYSLNRYKPAIEALKPALELAEQLGDRPAQLQALGLLAYSYQDLGDYNRASRVIQRAFFLAQQLNNPNAQITALKTQGALYYTAGLYSGAAAVFEKAVQLARQIQSPVLTGLLLNLGASEYKQGHFQTAIQRYQEGAQLALAQQNAGEAGKFVGNIGLAELGLGNLDKAQALVMQDVAIARQRQDSQTEGEAISFLGDISFARKDYAQALKHYQHSATILERFKTQRRLALLNRKIGIVLRELGKLRESEQALREAIALGEQQRRLAQGDDILNTASFDSLEETYTELQVTLIAQQRPEDALEASEQGRARAFADLLLQRRGQSNPAAPLKLEQIRQVAKRLNATLVQYSIRELAQDKIVFSGQLREDELYIWVVAPSGQVSFRQVDLKPLWQEPEATLAGVVGSARCFGNRACVRRAIAANRSVESVNNSTDSAAFKPQVVDRKAKATELQRLYALLIQPIADLLPTDPTAPVVFVPDSKLFEVPFVALTDAKGQVLIERHTILSSPSLQTLNLVHQRGAQPRPIPTGAATLVVGNPTMPKVPPAFGQDPVQLSPLPGAETEAKAIAQILETTAWTGGKATKNGVIQQMTQARVIHLATHGLLYNTEVITSLPGAVALAPNPGISPENQPDDNYGLLTTNEILNLNLKADLMVLSACDTGLGRVSGDGVAGLSRAILAAGVPSTIVSLWQVPDAPTSELMVTFYRGLKEQKLNKAQALRQAMLTTLKQYPNPVDWAAFTLIGNPD